MVTRSFASRFESGSSIRNASRLANDCAAHRDALLLAARELARAGGRAAPRGRAASRPPRRGGRSPASAACARAARSRGSSARSCAGTGRSSGRPSRGRGRRARAVVTSRSPIRMRPPVIFSRPADRAQERGLAAARRADEDHELALGDRHAHAVDRANAAGELLRHAVQHDFAHARRNVSRRGPEVQSLPHDSRGLGSGVGRAPWTTPERACGSRTPATSTSSATGEDADRRRLRQRPGARPPGRAGRRPDHRRARHSPPPRPGRRASRARRRRPASRIWVPPVERGL